MQDGALSLLRICLDQVGIDQLIEIADPQVGLDPEAFAVLHAYAMPQLAGTVTYLFQEAGFGNIGFRLARIIVEELGLKAADRFHFLLKAGRDINDQVGLGKAILDIVEYFFRAPCGLCLPFPFGFDLAQAAEEAGIGDQSPGPTMIGMPVGQGIGQYNLWLVMTQYPDDLQLVLLVVFEEAVGHFQVSPHRQAQYRGRSLCFIIAALYGAARAQLSFGKVQHTGSLSFADMVDQGTGAAQLHIIGVGAYGEYMQFHALPLSPGFFFPGAAQN